MRREETITTSGQATLSLLRLTTGHSRATPHRGQAITPRDRATARLSQAIALPVAIAAAEGRRHHVATTAEEAVLRRAAIMEAEEARARLAAIPAVAVEAAGHTAAAVAVAEATQAAGATSAWPLNTKCVRPRYFRGRSVPRNSDNSAVKGLHDIRRKQIEYGALMFTHRDPCDGTHSAVHVSPDTISSIAPARIAKTQNGS